MLRESFGFFVFWGFLGFFLQCKLPHLDAREFSENVLALLIMRSCPGISIILGWVAMDSSLNSYSLALRKLNKM